MQAYPVFFHAQTVKTVKRDYLCKTDSKSSAFALPSPCN
jgi:hypothetical protein